MDPHVTRPRLPFASSIPRLVNHERCNLEPRHLSPRYARWAGRSPIHSFVSLIVLPQVARKIPFDDPEVLLYARIGYVSAQLIVLAIYFVCSSRVSIWPLDLWIGGPHTMPDQAEERPDRSQIWQVFCYAPNLTVSSLLHPQWNQKAQWYACATFPLVPSSSFAPQSSDSGNLVTTTVRDYDLGEVSKGVRGVYTGLAMM